MGSVFKPTVTRALPAGAQVVTRNGKRIAVWTDAKGKKCQADVTDGDPPRIRKHATTYTASFRDGSGVVRRVATGCKSRDAARAVLADLEARAEKVRSGIVTAAEESVAEHADATIVEHIDAYVAALACKRGKGAKRTVSPEHVANVTRTLRLAADECGFRRLRDLHRDAVERWAGRLLDMPDDEWLAARTINARLAALTAWGNWLVESGRLTTNPFARLRKLEEADDVRRQRRALTADELERLLIVARLRPVAQFGRPVVRIIDDARPPKSRATWKRAELTFDTIIDAAERGRAAMRPENAEQFDRLGRERALMYRVLVTTGLRRGELASLTVGDVQLDGDRPAIVLKGPDAKSGKRATLPLRADVADELRAWVEEKAEAVCRLRVGVAGVVRAIDDMPLFDVPDKLVRILDRDLAAAGIPKRDERGFTVDVHAMRGTFASQLAAAGVSPVTLKTLMRHARIETTLTHYTDPALLDVAGAVESLPALTVAAGVENARATGTDDVSCVALNVATTPGHTCQKQTFSDKSVANARKPEKQEPPQNRSFARVRGDGGMGDTGVEPVTPSLSSNGTLVLSAENKALTARPAERCTGRCTENDDGAEELARLVALVARLPGTDAERADVLARAIARLPADGDRGR